MSMAICSRTLVEFRSSHALPTKVNTSSQLWSESFGDRPRQYIGKFQDDDVDDDDVVVDDDDVDVGVGVDDDDDVDDDDVDVVVVDDDDVFIYCILQMVIYYLEMPGRCPPDDVTSKRGRASRTSPVQSCH